MPNTERPLSPHLQIYRPQMTSATSIFHRMTGAALALGALAVTGWLCAAASGGVVWDSLQYFRTSLLGAMMLFGWLWCFVYHLLNGIRHLKWDTGYGLTIKSANLSGWLIIISSAIITVAIWIFGSVK